MNSDKTSAEATVTPSGREVCGTGTTLSLTALSLTAVKWNYAGIATKVVAQFVIGVVLARLLGPGPFGVYAAVLLVAGSVSLFVERGFGAALVQARQMSDEIVRYSFTWLLVTSTAAAIVLCAAAPAVAALFRYPALSTAIYGSALYVFVCAFSVVPGALLRRDLDMKSLQVAQIIAYLVGYAGVGVGGALLGLGTWSLVGALVTQSVVYGLIAYAQVRHAVRPLFRLRNQELTAFGNLVVATNLLNWAIENLDNLVVGRLYGIHALGLYAVSYNLVRLPTDYVITTLQSVLFAVASRAQENSPGLRKAYLTVISAVLLALCPILLGTASVAPTVVEGIYGRKWVGAGALLLPLALAMPVHAMLTGAGLLWAKGQGVAERKVQAGTLAIFMASLLVASRISLQAIAWAVLSVYILRALWLTSKILNSIQLSWSELFAAARGGLFLGAVTAGTLYMVNMGLAAARMISFDRLLILIAVGLMIVTILPICIVGLISSAGLRTILEDAVPQSPGLLRSVMKLYVKA
jgi:lipopolysaccharide exporter